MRKSVLVLAAFAALFIGACGADPDLQELGAGAAAQKAASVTALDNVFGVGDATVRIQEGGSVQWANQGRNDHDIVAFGDNAGWGVSAQRFRPGDEFRHVFADPGVYEYYCSLHGTETGGMRGRILVGDVAAPVDGPSPTGNVKAQASGNTVRVPQDQPTIQKAVDNAAPGDLILISPGVYHEAVKISEDKPYLTIRGLERNSTILDGEFKLANGFMIVKAKGVAIENLTARNYTKNGFFWTGVDGYRGSYLTAVRNGDYGVYAFESTNGQFDNSYASGSPDAGFYIGGCQPCNALITDVVSEWNGLGYSGTNSGGDLWIVNSVWRYNRAGIVPNSGSYEPNAPEDDNTIVGNLVHDNNNGETPAIDISIVAMGNGILNAGGRNNKILRNRVINHDVGGIGVISYPEDGDHFWMATGNIVRDNVITGSKRFDIGLWYGKGDDDPGKGNCFAGNDFSTSAPNNLEKQAPCDGARAGSMADGALDIGALASTEGKPASVPYEKTKLPAVPAQPNMADPATAPARPAVKGPTYPDLASITLPAPPAP